MFKLNEKIVEREEKRKIRTSIETKPMAFTLKQIMDKQTHAHTLTDQFTKNRFSVYELSTHTEPIEEEKNRRIRPNKAEKKPKKKREMKKKME